MKRVLSRDLAVGAVVLAGAFIFTLGIFSIGSQQNIWARKVTYLLRLPDANGLQGGSPVRLAGVQVGAVTEIHFPEDPNRIDIEVMLAVDEAHQHRIREDSVANLRILTMLGGEKYVEVTPGTPSKPALPPGSYIRVPQSFGMEQLGELSAGLADDLRSISNNVRVILETVQTQEGVVGRMLLDPNFGQQTFDDISATARLMRETMQEVRGGRGLVGRLVSDEVFARDTLASLQESVKRLDALLERAAAEDGVVAQALDPNGRFARSMGNFEQATADLQAFTLELKEGEGMLGRLISDKRYASEVLGNVKKISENIAVITDKLKRGDGTLGALVNDPQLFEDMKSVVRGVKDSRFLSWLIRHYREKGEKGEQDRLEQEEDLRRRFEEEEGAPPEGPPPGGGS